MKRRLYTYPLLWLLFFTCSVLNAQDSSQCFDISKVIYANSLSRYTQSTFIQKNEILPEKLPALSFRDGLVYSGTIPGRDVTKKAILRFSVCNTADTTISVWFFPGFFYSDISIYHEVNGRLAPLPQVSPEVVDNVGYRQIRLNGHDTARIYAELEFVRTHINTLRPRLIHAERIDSFIKDLQEAHRINNMVTFVFSGLLLMLILFSLVSFLQGANREYLYYAAYAFFVGAMLFTKAFYDRRPNAVGYFFEGYFDYIMQSLGIIFYMLFMRGFLNTRTRHPFLYHLYNFGVVMLLVSMSAFTYLHYFTAHFTWENAVENSSKFVLLIMTIIFLVYSVRKWDDKLLRFVFWGNLFLFVFSLFSLVLSLNANNITLPGIWDSSLLYYEIGLFLELVFFLMGLNYKNRKQIIRQTKERERLKRENQVKEYEKELAVYKAQQEERQRISTDMHDELGAGMTAIRLMSEIARNKMKESTPVEIERISHSADEVLNKMNAIIWSMNSGNDTLDNLVSYIRSYALEYFDGTQVECRVNTPVSIDNREITGDKRRNIFLCVKETLNNSLKHSGANLVTIDFTINDHLTIVIKDNGSGIDIQKLRQFGNGLKNIARRMESIGGTFTIHKENGTVTTLTLPI
jgi:signal transduction histidine kinase